MRKITVLGLTTAGVFLLATAALVLAGLHDKLAPADVIVVPGNTILPDGTPSPRLQARLDAALTQFQAHRAQHILVSGATGKEGFDEAASMAFTDPVHVSGASTVTVTEWDAKRP